MITIENVSVNGLEAAIRGMRNPLNSWEKSDSYGCDSWYDEECSKDCAYNHTCDEATKHLIVGESDLALMKTLVKAGTDHRKFMRFITVTCDITAPLYWWKEYDTYKVGTVANSCSTMYKITEKEFTLNDFSHEHLINMFEEPLPYSENVLCCCNGIGALEETIEVLNGFRLNYIETHNKKYWWQIIQLLPSSYNQKRTVLLNYEVLMNMYRSRKNHKLDEWRQFCEWIETLPYMRELLGVE